MRLAELHQAHRARQHKRIARHHARHDPHRSALRTPRQPSGSHLSRWPGGSRGLTLLHQLGLVTVHPPQRHGGRGLRRLPQPSGGYSMTEERAVLAGGCFWGMQDLFRRYDGVVSTRVGYAGGDVRNATYRNHGTHAEAIEIIFDPAKLSYRQILEFFFQIHDPSTRNRQGNDSGQSYRSAIFYTTDEQKRIAQKTIPDVNASGLWPGKVVTEVGQAGDFWGAEAATKDV